MLRSALGAPLPDHQQHCPIDPQRAGHYLYLLATGETLESCFEIEEEFEQRQPPEQFQRYCDFEPVGR